MDNMCCVDFHFVTCSVSASRAYFIIVIAGVR